MSRPASPAHKTGNWPADDEALTLRGALTIWFDPTMRRKAKSAGTRGRLHTCSNASVRTCPTMKLLFGMALRQAQSRATRPCARRNTSAGGSGVDGVATTAGAALKPRCTA